MINPVAGPAPADSRADSIAKLRERIAAMGGMSAFRPGVPLTLRDQSSSAPDPRRLGFVPESTSRGTAWVRRVTVDLGPYLERAGATGPARESQLAQLACRQGGDAPHGDRGAITVLDIESLGLRGSGVLAFLVGVGVPRGDRLDIDQLLVADPNDEAAMLSAVYARIAATRVIVSYNGRSFDVPMLVARGVINRISATVFEERQHSDLLAPVRRLFRDRLGGCTLRQAEVGLLGFERDDDVPGYEAPARYRSWLRSGSPAMLEGVVRHNELDLCSTMVLAARLADHVEGRLVAPVHPADRYHLGIHLERQAVAKPGRPAAAGRPGRVGDDPDAHYRAVFDAAHPPWDRRAGHRLARRLGRRGATAGDAEEALAVLRHLWSTDPGDLRAARALAISLERRGQLSDALRVSETAYRATVTLPRWGARRLRGEPPDGWAEDWRRRISRLDRRMEDQSSRRRRKRTTARHRVQATEAFSGDR